MQNLSSLQELLCGDSLEIHVDAHGHNNHLLNDGDLAALRLHLDVFHVRVASYLKAAERRHEVLPLPRVLRENLDAGAEVDAAGLNLEDGAPRIARPTVGHCRSAVRGGRQQAKLHSTHEVFWLVNHHDDLRFNSHLLGAQTLQSQLKMALQLLRHLRLGDVDCQFNKDVFPFRCRVCGESQVARPGAVPRQDQPHLLQPPESMRRRRPRRGRSHRRPRRSAVGGRRGMQRRARLAVERVPLDHLLRLLRLRRRLGLEHHVHLALARAPPELLGKHHAAQATVELAARRDLRHLGQLGDGAGDAEDGGFVLVEVFAIVVAQSSNVLLREPTKGGVVEHEHGPCVQPQADDLLLPQLR
mmetsp:Transcript_37611/g.100083  ORF Transcript_37611/g.100083 Transcript_37611/m.100083 type:complete len:357 (-) Transcript_37611:643-1713(-)